MEGVGDDGGGDRAGVGDAEGAVVLERPDVVGGGAEPRAEAVAAAEVFIGGVDRLGPGVELGDAAEGAGVAVAGGLPDGAGLAVEVFAAEPEGAGDPGVGTTGPIVGIPTVGLGASAASWNWRRLARRRRRASAP